MFCLLLHRPSRLQIAFARLQFVLILNSFQFDFSQTKTLFFVQITRAFVVFIAIETVIGTIAGWPRFFHRIQCFPFACGNCLCLDLLRINSFPFGWNETGRNCGIFFVIDRYAIDILVNCNLLRNKQKKWAAFSFDSNKKQLGKQSILTRNAINIIVIVRVSMILLRTYRFLIWRRCWLIWCGARYSTHIRTLKQSCTIQWNTVQIFIILFTIRTK